ncbi:hypothetical protein EG68_01028 [Paragonimus skrjabini miyazakii]|uniref:CBS domain-containing protein n=1 Tax=Paragonimus skrjabini miyazakii TaxID=59628 RepID=A0A8S9Z868_9TREM|nr:hypothetical protein EG68_01028 [Paragonimus skrjabini miyazakii]
MHPLEKLNLSSRSKLGDHALLIAKAFKALIYNEIRAAPVWNSRSQSMTAMLTLTDFVNMLNLCWSTSDAGATEERWTKLEIDDFDKLTIQKWKETSIPKTSVSPANVINGLLRSVGLGSRPTSALFRRLITVDPEDNLLNALRLLSRFRLHHLPVIDCPQQRTGNVLYVLTQRVMLSYLYGKLAHLPQPRFLQSSLIDLNVGTFNRIAMVTLNTHLRDAMILFTQERVSALPVVDSLENRRLINLFSQHDVITLVLSGVYKNPDLTIQEWLEKCKTGTPPIKEQRIKPPVEVCLASNNLLFLINRLVKTGFRRLVIVNNLTDYRVEGVVTLTDVLRFTVLQQARTLNLHAQPSSVVEVVEERDEADETLDTNWNETTDTKSNPGKLQTPPRLIDTRRQTKARVASPTRQTSTQQAAAQSGSSRSANQVLGETPSTEGDKFERRMHVSFANKPRLDDAALPSA